MLRPARVRDAPAIAEVNVVGWQTTYRGIISETFLASMSVAAQTDRWRARLDESSLCWVAVEGGQVVGYAMGGPRREGPPCYDGELYAIYLLPAAQGRGWGRRLVAQVASGLLLSGFASMLVWVLRDNPNLGFYQRLGGTEVASQAILIGGQALTEAALGWQSLSVLMIDPAP